MNILSVIAGFLFGGLVAFSIFGGLLRKATGTLKEYNEDLTKWNKFLCVIKDASQEKIDQYRSADTHEQVYLYPVIKEYAMIINELKRIYRPEELEDGDSSFSNE
jgi:hypothetical protein